MKQPRFFFVLFALLSLSGCFTISTRDKPYLPFYESMLTHKIDSRRMVSFMMKYEITATADNSNRYSNAEGSITFTFKDEALIKIYLRHDMTPRYQLPFHLNWHSPPNHLLASIPSSMSYTHKAAKLPGNHHYDVGNENFNRYHFTYVKNQLKEIEISME